MKKMESVNQNNNTFVSGSFQIHNILRADLFFHRVNEEIRAVDNKTPWCMLAIDIEHFKLFNEWYGYEAGDDFLSKLCSILKNIEKKYGGVAGYLQADNYALFLAGQVDYPAIADEIYGQIIDYLETVDHMIGFYPALGIYVSESNDVSAISAYDRSAIAMATVKGNYAIRIASYQEKMYQDMEWEHRVLLGIQRAIDRGEIIYYLQPKCNIMTGKIIGSEALVRWLHPQRGLIPPQYFIPLLEKNGLIGNVDLAVWKQVCRDLRKQLDEGKKPLPVSVNLSRIDIYTMDVVGELLRMTKEYQIDHSLLEVEITESSMAEDYSALQRLIDELSDHGFTVLMDDFGSGYSSLNVLKDVNVDVLKIDMHFLRLDEKNSNRGIGILESIVSIARLLNIKLIAEGVENERHLEILQAVGCMYVQGYYFYRPMPSNEFYEKIENSELVDTRGVLAHSIGNVDIASLIRNQELSLSMMDKILGAFAFFTYDGQQISVERVNQSYCSMLQESRIDIEEYRDDILGRIYKADREEFIRAFDSARENVVSGSKVVYRYVGKRESWMWQEMSVFLLKDMGQRQIYYAKIRDVSEQKKKQYELEQSQKALMNAIHITDNDSQFKNLAEENQRVATSLYSHMLPGGIMSGYCENGFPLLFASTEMIRLLGYDTYEEFCSCTQELVENTIYVDDREQVKKDIGDDFHEGLTYTTSYRMVKKDGSLFWTLDKGHVIRTEDGRLAILSVCFDVTEIMNRQETLRDQVEQLSKLNQELYYFHNQLPGGYHRCANEPGYPFLYISNRFLDMFGYTRQEIKELFDDKFSNMVHPDDRQKMNEGVDKITGSSMTHNFEYRMQGKNGYIWVIDQSAVMQYGDENFVHGVIMDVTDMVILKNRFQVLMKSTKEDIVVINYANNTIDFEIITCGFIKGYGYSEEGFKEFLRKFRDEATDSKNPYHEFTLRMNRAFRMKNSVHEVLPIEFHGKPQKIMVNCEYLDELDGKSRFLCVFSDITDHDQI